MSRIMKCDGCGAESNDEAQVNPANVSLYTNATKGVASNLGWAIVQVLVMAPLPELSKKLRAVKHEGRINASVKSAVDMCPNCLVKMLSSVGCVDKIAKEHSTVSLDEIEMVPAHQFGLD